MKFFTDGFCINILITLGQSTHHDINIEKETCVISFFELVGRGFGVSNRKKRKLIVTVNPGVHKYLTARHKSVTVWYWNSQR